MGLSFILVLTLVDFVWMCLINHVSFAASIKIDEHSEVNSSIAVTDTCSVFKALILSMNEQILFVSKPWMKEADSALFHVDWVTETGWSQESGYLSSI